MQTILKEDLQNAYILGVKLSTKHNGGHVKGFVDL